MVALTEETWWKQEFAAPALVTLRSRLLSFWGLPSENIGMKGDVNHRRGYHRSYAWIKNSVWCTNRTYSVSETPGNQNPGNDNWICAMDITLQQEDLLVVCQRLDQTIRSGALEKITEWYGNLDGDTRVDGYNNIQNVMATSDSSHLWHLHMSFDRGMANNDHTDVYETLTGEDVSVADVRTGIAQMADEAANRSTPTGRNLANDLYAIIQAALPNHDCPPVTLTPEDRAAIIAELTLALPPIVRAELDKTHLTGPPVTP